MTVLRLRADRGVYYTCDPQIFPVNGNRPRLRYRMSPRWPTRRVVARFRMRKTPVPVNRVVDRRPIAGGRRRVRVERLQIAVATGRGESLSPEADCCGTAPHA